MRISIEGRGKVVRSAAISGRQEITNSMRRTPSIGPDIERGKPVSSGPNHGHENRPPEGSFRHPKYDSAVRKAFLVIKQKASTKYHMSAQLDGEDMVNFLFSESGKLRVHKDEKKRKAFRDFVSGFFRFFRNEFMHDLSADEHVPVQCTLATAVFILQHMDIGGR
jgi:hypothetical protein